MTLRRDFQAAQLEQEHINNAVQTQHQELHERINKLDNALRKLHAASHDHCIHCGAMTPRYGATECGRADCAQHAVDRLIGPADTR